MRIFFQSSSQVKCQGFKLRNLKNLQTGSCKCDQFTSPMAAWWPRTRFGLGVWGRPTASSSWFPSCWKVPSPVSARLCKATAAWGWEIRWPRPSSVSACLGRCNFHLDETEMIFFLSKVFIWGKEVEQIITVCIGWPIMHRSFLFHVSLGVKDCPSILIHCKYCLLLARG